MYNNGGVPIKNTFDTDTRKRCKINKFMDFYDNDCLDDDSIWSVYAHYSKPDRCVPFAFANHNEILCFDENNKVILVNPDTLRLQPEKVADNFDEFLKCLY